MAQAQNKPASQSEYDDLTVETLYKIAEEETKVLDELQEKYFQAESVYVWTRFGYSRLDLDQFQFDLESVKVLQAEVEKQFTYLKDIRKQREDEQWESSGEEQEESSEGEITDALVQEKI